MSNERDRDRAERLRKVFEAAEEERQKQRYAKDIRDKTQKPIKTTDRPPPRKNGEDG